MVVLRCPLLANLESWPDSVDALLIAVYLAIILGVPLAGYAWMALDLRAYYRSLRRALVLVTQYSRRLPGWVGREPQTPACLEAFGLQAPCTEEELLQAYRERVKEVHPDLGGNPEEFLLLQRYFEEARSLLE